MRYRKYLQAGELPENWTNDLALEDFTYGER